MLLCSKDHYDCNVFDLQDGDIINIDVTVYLNVSIFVSLAA